MSFLECKVRNPLPKHISTLRISFSRFEVCSCLVCLKVSSRWPLGLLTWSLWLRLHANLLPWDVESPCVQRQIAQPPFRGHSCPHFVAVLPFQSVFFHALFFPASQQQSPKSHNTVKVLYTRKCYPQVERVPFAPPRPKFAHNTPEKALFKKHLF